MTSDPRLSPHEQDVPLIAFFGVMGGAGKTTIARRFAELTTFAPAAPNVLLLDADVYQRDLTVEMTRQGIVSCPRLVDYVETQDVSDVEAAETTSVVRGPGPETGRVFFIPSATRERRPVFEASAGVSSERMLELLGRVITAAANRYDCACAVIDCGRMVDPFSAAAAALADWVFVVGRNEATTFARFQRYNEQIREFQPGFAPAKAKIILNKLRSWEMAEPGHPNGSVFDRIPHTGDVVDVSEGLKAGDEMKEILFEEHIREIVARVFSHRPSLVPDFSMSLPDRWRILFDQSGRLDCAPKLLRLKGFRVLLPAGLLAALAGAAFSYRLSTHLGVVILLFGIASAVVGLAARNRLRTYVAAIEGLRTGGVEWLVREMTEKRSARKTFDRLLAMSSTVPVAATPVLP